MKVALVYDRVNKFGGAERVLFVLHQIWSEAPLFTAVYDRRGAPWADDFRVIPSFVQKVPFSKKHHEVYPWIMPLAFESFNFDNFDVVISITSAEAKGIITKPQTLHICYCLTPTRYLWSGYKFYKNNQQFGVLNVLAKPIFHKIAQYLRKWDRIACNRPDYYLAISQETQKRIKKYYNRESKVIYPPVDLNKFKEFKSSKFKARNNEEFFLVVSRLVPYKRIDLVVKAFNQLNLPLKIIGIGSEFNKLRKMAKGNIEFLEQLTDDDLISYYQKCVALIFPGEEDFGIAPVEAQALGRPVIAYYQGGAKETVIEGKTGIFFEEKTVESLKRAILKFKSLKFENLDCIDNAKRFDEEIFIKKFKSFVEEKWNQHQKKFK